MACRVGREHRKVRQPGNKVFPAGHGIGVQIYSLQRHRGRLRLSAASTAVGPQGSGKVDDRPVCPVDFGRMAAPRGIDQRWPLLTATRGTGHQGRIRENAGTLRRPRRRPAGGYDLHPADRHHRWPRPTRGRTHRGNGRCRGRGPLHLASGSTPVPNAGFAAGSRPPGRVNGALRRIIASRCCAGARPRRTRQGRQRRVGRLARKRREPPQRGVHRL